MRNLERLSSVEPFSSFGKPLSMGKGIPDLEIVQDKDVHEFLEKKADHAFQRRNSQLRQDYLKHSLNWTEENGECEIPEDCSF